MDANITFRLDSDSKTPEENKPISQEQMLADAGQILEEFGLDYARMAE